MLDPILSLAHSIQTNKGIFAVLLGSGVSRAAGIPTGWEVTLDLVRRVAAMESENPGADPAAWFKAKHGQDADYSAVLAALAKSGPERRAILHSLFEPTEEDRELGLKVPTEAHRAIARLVASGHFCVIVTTNFDRLMELALQDEGVVPTVISTADAVKGAVPLTHQRCLILKVHGDYLDDRIKNTEDELSSYDAAVDGYLDRIFDEFGLVICGWSGEWDPALRAAIDRSPSRRYATYWTMRGQPSIHAEGLINRRGATAIAIDNADQFFSDLEGKTNALTQLTALGVFSSEVAAFSESTKWYFPLSEHLRRAIFPAVPGGDPDRSDHFDRLEVLLALAFLDIAAVGDAKPTYMPYGRFAAHHDDSAYTAVFDEFEREGEGWGPIQTGMFAGSVTRFEQVQEIFIELLKTNSTRWW